MLVIIGLIIGSILSGKQLLESARLRSTIAQYDKYNAAVNAFIAKYGGFPGDLKAKNAAAFGLCPVTSHFF